MSKRRILLLSILTATLAANLAYLMYPRPRESFDFTLEPLNFSWSFEGNRPSIALPVFNGHSWSVSGEPVSDLAEHLLDTDESPAPHTFGKIMLIELPESAGPQQFRAAIADLAEQGICIVAVFQESAPATQQGSATAVRVRNYRDATGHSRVCIDKVNGEA